MSNIKGILVIFINFLNNNYLANELEEIDIQLNEKIENIVNINDQGDSNEYFIETTNINEPVQEAKIPQDINNEDSNEEYFYIQYILEYLEEPTTNVNTIISLLKNIEETSCYFLMINDLVRNSIIINDNKINLSNNGYILFDNEIIYENQDKRKFIFLLNNIQYMFLMKLLYFLVKITNNKKYIMLLTFFENFNVDKYVQKENKLLDFSYKNVNSQSNILYTSPLNISKTIPNLNKKSKKNNKKTLKLKKSIELNKNIQPKPSIKVFEKNKKKTLKKTKKNKKK